MAVEGIDGWVDLVDFTAGIYTDLFTGLAGSSQAAGFSNKDGALQEDGTYGCYGMQGGGLAPLPRPRGYLQDAAIWDTTSTSATRPTRVPIIAAKVVAPIQGAETADLRKVILAGNPIFFYQFEDATGAHAIHNETSRTYDMVVGNNPPVDLGGYDVALGYGGGVGYGASVNTESFDESNSTILGPDMTWVGFTNSAGSWQLSIPEVSDNALATYSAGDDKGFIGVLAVHAVESFEMFVQTKLSHVTSTNPSSGPSLNLMLRTVVPSNAIPSGEPKSRGIYVAAIGYDGAGGTLIDIERWAVDSGGGIVTTIIGSQVTVATGAWANGDTWIYDSYDIAGVAQHDVYRNGVLVHTVSGNGGLHLTGTYGGVVVTGNSPTYTVRVDEYKTGEHIDLYINPLGGKLYYHGDFGTLGGGPIITPVTFTSVTDGMFEVSDGFCGKALALADAYVRFPEDTGDPALYQTQFTLACRIKVKTTPVPGGVILLKDVDTGLPLMSLNINSDMVAGVIYNTQGVEYLGAEVAPAGVPITVTNWIDYVLTYDGTTLRLWANGVSIATDTSTTGTRATSSNPRFEVYGNIAAFDELAYYSYPFSSFQVAVRFNAVCNGGGFFRSQIAVAYQWFENDGATMKGHTRVRLYKPFALAPDGGILATTSYDPFFTTATLGNVTTPLKYGYAGFDLARTNKADPTQPGNPFLVCLAAPGAYDTDSSHWSIFIVPDPDSDTTNSFEVVTTGYATAVFAHQGRIVFIGTVTLGEHFAGNSNTLDVFERIGYTDFNDHSSIASNFASLYAPENPTGYGSWVSLNSAELLLIKRKGGAVVVRDDLDSPTVVRLPGVPSTGKFANLGVDTPFGYVYGSERGAWIWTGGDSGTLISPQLNGRFLWPGELPDSYLGLCGSFTFSEPYVYAPNSWVMDTRTGSWFRLRTHSDILDTPFPTSFHDVDLDGIVYAFSTIVTTKASGAAADGKNVFCQIYDPQLGDKKYQATTQPLARTRGREHRFRQILLFASGSGTVTITLRGLDGATATEVFSVNPPTFNSAPSTEQVALRAGTSLSGTDVVCVILSEGDGDNPAPVVHHVALGYGERQRLSNQATT